MNVFKLFQEEKKLLELKVKYEKSTEKKKHDRYVYYTFIQEIIFRLFNYLIFHIDFKAF